MIQPPPNWSQSPCERNRTTFYAQLSLTDRSHLEPLPLASRYAPVNVAVRAFFLAQGNSREQWQVVNSDHTKFNQVWRQMLNLHADITPPPSSFRFSVSI